MTTWVENPEGGRERGARGLVRAWLELLTRPRRFFRNGISPGDQSPGLSFVIVVSFCYTAVRFATLPAARPGFFASEAASVLVGLLLATFIIGPVGLHLDDSDGYTLVCVLGTEIDSASVVRLVRFEVCCVHFHGHTVRAHG